VLPPVATIQTRSLPGNRTLPSASSGISRANRANWSSLREKSPAPTDRSSEKGNTL
jgi:hypothetical protein